MGWLKNMATEAAIKMLNIKPANTRQVTIYEVNTFESETVRNRMWYRGDGSELDQFFKKSYLPYDTVAQSRFWAAVPRNGSQIRKIHSGLPAMIVDKMSDIIIADLDNIKLENAEDQKIWDEISKENKFQQILGESITECFVDGDGAFKISIDTEISDYPLIEFYGGDRVSYQYKRGRLQAIIFHTTYISANNKTYCLHEQYKIGSIDYKLFDDAGKEVSLNTLPETANLKVVNFEADFMMAVKFSIFKSPKYQGRGKSLFASKSEDFDALDEVISQWIDAIRKGRVLRYIPESLLPKDPMTGEILPSNAFDNDYIATVHSMSEGSSDKIEVSQAGINFEAFVQSYASFLDICLQGIMSPATLGIDLKKNDSSESQREKEKTTLYTRGKVIDVLTNVIPELINVVMKTNDVLYEQSVIERNSTVEFGEYASPSFDTVVETVTKAKTAGIMSVEQAVEQLYGDTWSNESKDVEVKRIKDGESMKIDEPVINEFDELKVE